MKEDDSNGSDGREAKLLEFARPELKEIQKYKDSSAATASEQRRASLDEKIKYPQKGENAIIPVELLRFERKTDPMGGTTYEPHPISVDDVLRSPEPNLLLCNWGGGKSTAAIDLTERLNSSREYLAILTTAREINEGIFNALVADPDRNDQITLNLLSKGAISGEMPIPESIRREYKLVFVIDALDEVRHHREHVIHIVRDADGLQKYGKVIVTSRFEGVNPYENSRFTTLHLDPQSVIRNIDQYLALRITDPSGNTDSERLARFKEFLMRQDEGVKTNYLVVYFLTNIYNQRPEELGDLKGTISEGEAIIKGIEIALWDQKLPKRPNLKQKPYPYPGQPAEEAAEKWRNYDAERAAKLGPWMDFSQRAATYKTTHGLEVLARSDLEIVYGGWTLAKHIRDVKRSGKNE